MTQRQHAFAIHSRRPRPKRASTLSGVHGANRPGAKVSQGILDQFWLWSMQSGQINAYECIRAFSETDFTEDLKKFDVPTLVMHGEDDPIRSDPIRSDRAGPRLAQEVP